MHGHARLAATEQGWCFCFRTAESEMMHNEWLREFSSEPAARPANRPRQRGGLAALFYFCAFLKRVNADPVIFACLFGMRKLLNG